MVIFSTFKNGMRKVNKNKRMLFVVFVANILFALFLAYPMYSTLQESMGSSLIEKELTKGFDYQWWVEFRHDHQGFVNSLHPSMIGVGALLNNVKTLLNGRLFKFDPVIWAVSLFYLLLGTFFAGGILATFNAAEGRFSLDRFFQGCGFYFFRFFRLLLISIIFYLFIYLVIGFGLKMLSFIVSEQARTERIPFFVNLTGSVIMLFLLLLVNMIFDYAKIQTVVDEGRSMIKQAGRSLHFVFRNFGKTLGLYYLIGIIAVAFMIIYALIESWIPQTAIATILIVFIWQQLYIISKIWVKFNFYSCQISLYKSSTVPQSSRG